MIDIEEIKDIFIHFEDNYSVKAMDKNSNEQKMYSANRQSGIILDVPSYLSRVTNNNPISISELITITLNKKRKGKMLSFDEWTIIQTNLETSIRRLDRYGFKTECYFLSADEIFIYLYSDPILELKNMGDLNKVRKRINLLNLGRIDYSISKNRLVIRFYKMDIWRNRSMEFYRSVLKDDFIIKDLTIDGQITNRKGEISGDQQNGYIFELEPKNIDIYV